MEMGNDGALTELTQFIEQAHGIGTRSEYPERV